MSTEVMEKFQKDVVAQLNRIEQTPGPLEKKLDAWLAVLSSYKQRALVFDIAEQAGWKVLSGPFAGLDLEGNRLDPCHLLGLYESALHRPIEDLLSADRNYCHVLNIGCAFGYYAVGIARRLPDAKIHAHDIDPVQQEACKRTAEKNGVTDRIEIKGVCQGEAFQDFPANETLVFCDIEGGERELLDPDRYPALKNFDLVVEIHQVETEGTRALLEERFALTHEVDFIPNGFVGGDLPEVLWQRNSLDQTLAVWEGRGEPTPWLIMQAKRP